MKYSVYCEYPNEENLGNLSHLEFPLDVIVCAENLREFEGLQRQIKQSSSNVNRVGYWPKLDKKEGYWICPFSDENALNGVFGELEERVTQDENLLLMLDLEPPVLLDPKRMITGLKGFTRKKQRLKKFISDSKSKNIDVIGSEVATFKIPEVIQRTLGLAFDPDEIDYEKVKLVYTSFVKLAPGLIREPAQRFMRYLLKRETKKGIEKYGDKFSVGLGCLSKGVLGYEPILIPEDFRADLETVNNQGLKKVYVYDLKGINKDYASVMKEYHSN